MRRNTNPIWPFTEEQRIINRCAMAQLPKNHGPERILRVSTPYFTADAVWQKICGLWSCVQADPIIRWMKGMTPQSAKIALLKMGADYQFLERSLSVTSLPKSAS